MGTPNFNLPQYGPDDPASLPALNAGLLAIDAAVQGLLDTLGEGGGVQPGTFYKCFPRDVGVDNTNYANTTHSSWLADPQMQILLPEGGLFFIQGGFRYLNNGAQGGFSTYFRLTHGNAATNGSGTWTDGPNANNGVPAGAVNTMVDQGSLVGGFRRSYNGLGYPSPGNVGGISRAVAWSGYHRFNGPGILQLEIQCNDNPGQTASLTSYGQRDNGYILAYKVAT